jgi:hypothetical protein
LNCQRQTGLRPIGRFVECGLCRSDREVRKLSPAADMSRHTPWEAIGHKRPSPACLISRQPRSSNRHEGCRTVCSEVLSIVCCTSRRNVKFTAPTSYWCVFHGDCEGFVDKLIALGFLIVATTLEATGDAVVRMGLNQEGLASRAVLFLAGAVLLFGYGLTLNLAPLEFGRVVGLYIAALFVVWQIVNFIAFRSVPSWPILVGGVLIVVGGSIVAFWEG